ncbi:DUF378 domain-containing protein [Salinicoccus sp. HZC-1]|uniref:DUF378 domain-containing protein n=1 Tax=Salinicoccus sp. HZC-1 TaxID=3385497 RepID=UPI00398B97B9
MKALDMLALALVIIGGLNWLLVGLFEFDLVASIFGGQDSILSKIIYILVGLAALYSLKFFGYINEHYADAPAARDDGRTTDNERDDVRTTDNERDDVRTTDNERDDVHTVDSKRDDFRTMDNEGDEVRTPDNERDNLR